MKKKSKVKKEPKFKAYIASNRHSKAFDTAYGITASAAEAAVKRKNSPDWEDCYVWSKPI